MISSDWVTLKEAAILTGVSVRTIWRYIGDFNLDTGRHKGKTLVNVGDIRRASLSNSRGNPLTARQID